MVPLKIIIPDITWEDNALFLIFGCGRQIREFYLLSSMFGLTLWFTVEAYMAKQLTPGILDQEVWSWSLTHRVVSLDKGLNSN